MYRSLHKFIIMQSIFSQMLVDLEKRHEELLATVRNLEEQKSIIEGLIKKKAKMPWPWGHPTTHPYVPVTEGSCGAASSMDAPMSMNTSAIVASWCTVNQRGVYCRSLCTNMFAQAQGRLTYVISRESSCVGPGTSDDKVSMYGFKQSFLMIAAFAAH